MKAFSKDGLIRLESTLKHHVESGSVPGLVALVNRGDDTHVFAIGKLALDGPQPVKRDTIFRIASMTKAVTAAAVMMLIEDGTVRLKDRAENYLPELSNRRVLKRIDGPIDDTVPAERSITVEDLLDFRLGWGIVFSDKPLPILEAIGDLPGFGMPNPRWPGGPDDFMRRLGALPLMYQPGERWLYTLGSNLQGVLIARASGMSLEDFFALRILEPLGMKDTSFGVPKSKLSRLAAGYWFKDGALALFDPPEGLYSGPPKFPEGDSGLVSTVDDYLAFARFLGTGLGKDKKRVLSKASLNAMKRDHLTPQQREWGSLILGQDNGWGYGMAVMGGAAAGAYGWYGGLGTSWISDSGKDLIAIALTQRVFDSPDPPAVHKDFRNAAYQALA